MAERAALSAPRLRIEPLREDHADLVFAAQQDPLIYTYVPQDPMPREELRRRYAFLAGGKSPDGTQHWLNWTAFLHDTQTAVGTFQATVPLEGKATIGYTVFRAFWRQGFAAEMGRCVIPHLFAVYAPPEIYAEIDTRNTGSIKLVESWGFARVGVQEDADFFKGQSSDEYTYCLTHAQWQAGGLERS